MGVVHVFVLGRLLRATTKKVVNFFEEISAPPDKILATPMDEGHNENIIIVCFGHRCVNNLTDVLT